MSHHLLSYVSITYGARGGVVVPWATIQVLYGFRFRAKRSLSMDSMVEFVLKLPGHRQGVKAYGRVVRVSESDDGEYEMALEIMDIDTREFSALTRYLSRQASAASGELKPD